MPPKESSYDSLRRHYPHQVKGSKFTISSQPVYKLPCSFVIIVIMGKIVNKVLEYNKYQA